MKITSVIGIDPGLTTGIALVDYDGMNIVGRTQIQVYGEIQAQLVLEAMLRAHYTDPAVVTQRFAGIEAFVTGKSAGTRGAAADVTRQLVMKFAEQLQMWGYYVKVRKAGDVKTWASDKRLTAAGLLASPEMRHASDAARHALFAAHTDAHREDPLR